MRISFTQTPHTNTQMASHLNLTMIIMTLYLTQTSVAQQPYVGVTTSDCANAHNSSSGLGYFCNGPNTTCRSFLTFRSTPPSHDTVVSISSLLNSDPAELASLNSVAASTKFNPNKLVLVPIPCSCSGQQQQRHYQSNTSYAILQGDNYFTIANSTFQGLSTCQAIADQPGNSPPTELSVGERIAVPLRCACPTRSQADNGTKYLVSYSVANGDTVFGISQRFGVSVDSIYRANGLSELDNRIVGFTTLLVPLENPPSSNQTVEPVPAPTTPTTPTTMSPPSTSSRKKKTWLYALIGAIVGVVVLLAIGSVVYCRVFRTRRKKREFTDVDPILGSESFEPAEKRGTKDKRGQEDELSRDFLEAISDIAQSIKVYKFSELKKATGGFGPSCLIRGSVYRGVINGDLAAIKKVDGDISGEINLLQKINHSNVIRLSGVGFNEGYWYLVYEYASNGPLSDSIFGGRVLTWSQRIQIGLDVATGLNYLHSFTSPPHVHKDMKSGNILLDTDLRAKIANFGLARSTVPQGGQDGQYALTKHIVGTIGYMAPEYLEHGLVSTKLDVYAFGVVLLEMVTGKEVSVLSEEKKKLSDVISGVVEGKENGVRGLVDVRLGERYPHELVGFVVKLIDSCLKKNPAERPSMDEIVQFLSITLSNSLTWELSHVSS